MKLDYDSNNQIKAAQFAVQATGEAESINDFEGFTSTTGEIKSNEISENKSFVEWSHWKKFLDIQKCYARVYSCIVFQRKETKT